MKKKSFPSLTLTLISYETDFQGDEVSGRGLLGYDTV
jgi:hypothetical protein